MSDEALGQHLASLHMDLRKKWLIAGPEEVLELLADLPRSDVEALVMAYLGAHIGQV